MESSPEGNRTRSPVATAVPMLAEDINTKASQAWGQTGRPRKLPLSEMTSSGSIVTHQSLESKSPSFAGHIS